MAFFGDITRTTSILSIPLVDTSFAIHSRLQQLGNIDDIDTQRFTAVALIRECVDFIIIRYQVPGNLVLDTLLLDTKAQRS